MAAKFSNAKRAIRYLHHEKSLKDVLLTKRQIANCLLLTLATLLIFNPLWSQNVSIPNGESIFEEHERPTMPYLPNAYNNQKTTPGYRQGIAHSSKTQSTSILTVQVNVDSNQQNIVGDAASEPSIAVNPLNPNEMAIGWRQFDNVASDFRQAGAGFSTDGGQSWQPSTPIAPGIFRSDPVLDYDADGRFYYNSLTIDSIGFPCKVFRSEDAGRTWDGGVGIFGGDKAWMTIDRTTGSGSGNIYSTWTQGPSYCFPGFFTRSTDGGDTYENCTEVDGHPFWSTMAVGNAGELYMAGVEGNSSGIVVTRSADAKIAGASITWDTALVYLDGFLTGWKPINPVGLIGQTNIDVDRSNGPGRGNVYVLASVQRYSVTDPADVMFAKSTDGGQTWSPPVRINDDERTADYQWFGTMSVAPNGRIDAIWLDTRDAPLGTDASALYYSGSTDQGATWSANEKLSDLFDPHLGYPQQEKLGDYFDMVSDDDGAHLSWANTFNGEQDVYYSHIVPSLFVRNQPTMEMVDITISPNPSAGQFVVAADRNPVSVMVHNIWGEQVYASKSFRTLLTIDISTLPAGIYFLQLETAAGDKAMRKLVKE